MFNDLDISSALRPPAGINAYYVGSRAPLQPTALTKLPITAFAPDGWLRRSLELQRDGLTGHLGEISKWLTKTDNAWLNPSGQGQYGWEEVPYWLRGYTRIGYVLQDPRMITETKVWVEGTLNSARPDGDFGPIHNHSQGFRDLWAQMLMLQVLQSWYEYSADPRVLPFMTNYFKWEASIPDAQFLKDYWENSRGGDNLASVYWLYDRTGDAFLLDLAKKIDRNTANWRMTGDLPNYHNVNIAQCFREPATFWLQSKDPRDLQATYDDQDFIREKYGQVPGGMFGSDENCRPGHDDPHQGVETCGMVEQMMSNGYLTAYTGDQKWADNTEDVAFNTFPVALTADNRALRYFTAPNMVVSDSKNHAPGIANDGPFFLMNPYSSRCCQHNHGSGWVNYLEGSWMATSDNGLAGLLYHEGAVHAKVGDGTEVTVTSKTHYPFADGIDLTVTAPQAVRFPLYLRIPAWAAGATATVGGKKVDARPGQYLRLEKTWASGDSIHLTLPMTPSVKRWPSMRDSASVQYGPLTFSLKIGEEYRRVDSKDTAISDSGWQPTADPSKWPSFEILPTTPWNYGLIADSRIRIIRKPWPADNDPFTLENCPLELEMEGKQIPSWTLDENGLAAVLPKSPVTTSSPKTQLRLVPMGAARLRISSFPVVR